MAPLVSIVMPCFNAGRMLAPALQSAFEQTYPHVEVIFVDNNSSDDSAARAQAIAEKYRRPFRLLRCAEQGCNFPRNAGYALARGAYIQWLDADDALGREKIALQVAALEGDAESDIAYCDWMHSRHTPEGARVDRVMRLAQHDDHLLRILSGIWYPPHAYLIRRKAADRLQAESAWFPGRKVGTDVEYVAVAAMLGMRFRHVPGARVQYNSWSNTQISSRGTPYDVRRAALRDIFARLRQLAEREDVAPRISVRHKILLEQNWDVWAMPAGTVEVLQRPGGRYELRQTATGRTVEAQPREAEIARAMQTLGERQAIAHHALAIAGRLGSLRGREPYIVETLERFRREGLLSPAKASARSQADVHTPVELPPFPAALAAHAARAVAILRELVRWREWYDTKLPFFMVGALYALLGVHAPGSQQLEQLGALGALLCLYAAFGHIVNDYADRETDRIAGKQKILHGWGVGAALLSLTLPLACIVVLALTRFDHVTALLAFAAVLLAAGYSLRPVRLKERGSLGLIAATIAQRTLPIAIALQAFRRWDWAALGLCVLATLIGLRFIIVHQLRDRQNDLRSHVRTAATGGDPQRLEALLRSLFAFEIIFLVATVTAMASQEPLLWIGVLAYAVGLALSMARGSSLSPAQYFVFSGFYSVVWPLALALLLSLRNPVFAAALLVIVALTQHHARARFREAFALPRSAATAASSPRHPFGQTPSPTTAIRPLDEAISAGRAALARMQEADGSFPFFLGERMSPWRSCGRLFSTAYVMLGAAGSLPPESIARAVDFIRKQRRPDGLWEYDPAGKTIPPDADSSACSLAALALHGEPADVVGGADLLRSYWRPGAGPFRTWREPAERAAPERDDAVVNCNVAFALRLMGAPLTPDESAAVIPFLRAAHYTQYYCSPATIAHAARRAGLDPAILSAAVIARPHARDLLGCAQWLCGLRHPDQERIAALLAAQRADGAWPIWPWVTGEGSPKQYWGSPAVTTALVLEALTLGAA